TLPRHRPSRQNMHRMVGAASGRRRRRACPQNVYTVITLANITRCASMVSRVLLIVNRSAATGHSTDLAARLFHLLQERLAGSAAAALAMVDDHPQARECAQEFLADSSAPAAILSAGGGGTLRAVIEGVCGERGPGDLPDRECIQVGILRMG